ncbi:hypothetical protein D3C78_1096180 [compost metagenome]
MRLITRCSVGVNSRPSTLVGKRPSPPNRLSTAINTRLGANTNSAVPRSGFRCTRLRLVGTGRLRANSWYGWILIGPTVMSGLRRSRLNNPMRNCRAKRSLMISSACSRSRTTRRWVVGSYGLTSLSLRATASGSSPALSPLSKASISACERMLSPIVITAI